MSYVIEKRIGGRIHVLSVFDPWSDPIETRWSTTDRPVLCCSKEVASAVLVDLADPEAGYREATANEIPKYKFG
jgi:hypothetical protein